MQSSTRNIFDTNYHNIIMNVCLTFYFLWYQKLSLISNVCYWTEKENEIGPIWYFMSIPTWGGRKHESVYRYNNTSSIHVIMKNVVSGLIQHYSTRNNDTFYYWHIYHSNKIFWKFMSCCPIIICVVLHMISLST